ncbi:MAG TPA: hypothetical protein VMU50_10300 [Polyangia bacterium]|nr:hypothetical protein [Polyangia bacterium]
MGASLAAAVAGPAHAYDFTIDVQTIGQGYQVRRYAPTGANDLLTRRRLTQYLSLNVTDITPEAWRRETDDRNQLSVDVSMRFDSDFGGYLLSRPTGTDEIRELTQNHVEVLYAYVAGRNLGGRVDFQLGRQVHFDLVDFYAFDGADVSVRVRRPLSVEAFAGTEVRGERPLSSPIYELDGTSVGSQDPATRPDQATVLRPLAGGALVLDGWGPVQARLAYRRMWSATADQQLGEPSSGVNDEKVALTASAALAGRVSASLGLRYNILVGLLDDEQAALRVQVSHRQALSAEYAFLAPTFDGDSIWNIFSAGAYRDLRATYELTLIPGLRLSARAFVRLFQRGPDEPAGASNRAGGGSLGVQWRTDRSTLRADGYFDDGYGGRKAGGDLSGRYTLRWRTLDLEGRLSGWGWRSDTQPDTNHGVVFGVQAGGRFLIAEGMHLHLLAEDNVGTLYRGQYRGLAVFEVDVSL